MLYGLWGLTQCLSVNLNAKRKFSRNEGCVTALAMVRYDPN